MYPVTYRLYALPMMESTIKTAVPAKMRITMSMFTQKIHHDEELPWEVAFPMGLPVPTYGEAPTTDASENPVIDVTRLNTKSSHHHVNLIKVVLIHLRDQLLPGSNFS